MPGWEEESGEPFEGMGEVRFMTIEMTFEKKEEGKRKRETRSYNVYPRKVLSFIDDLAICNNEMEYPRGMLQCWLDIAKEQEAEIPAKLRRPAHRAGKANRTGSARKPNPPGARPS